MANPNQIKTVSNDIFMEELEEGIGFLFMDSPKVIESNGKNNVKIEVNCKIRKGQLKSKAAFYLAVFTEVPEMDRIMHPLNKDEFIEQVSKDIKNLPVHKVNELISHYSLWSMGAISELSFSTDKAGVFIIRHGKTVFLIAQRSAVAFLN